MRFSCPFCHYAISVDDSVMGFRTECQGCNKNILVPAHRFDEGCIIGDFIINSHLGKGAVGDVYKATQITLDRPVALKVLKQQSMTEKGVKAFMKEARSASRLSHINLVQSYAVGTDEGYIYMAMTYIKGETLRSRLKRIGIVPVDEALHIIQQVAEALFYAWDECRIIHRDVKPENIMLTEKGIVKLTDLGLAMQQREWAEDMEISGSPSYMSPEQFAGEKLDTRSDIYSLGITLYQMLSGKLPFAADTVTGVAQQHFEEEAVPLDKINPAIPSNVVKLVEKMMEKEAEDRFSNMEELLKEIWTIRQKTAPAKELVPDVHTISAKRLDYEKQNEQAIRKRQQNPVTENTNTSSPKYWLWGLPAILIVLVLVALLWDSKETRRTKDLEERLSVFEQLANDPSYPLKKLEEDAEHLMNDCSVDFKTLPAFRYAPDRIRYLLLKRKQNVPGK
ncbi:MAG: serine/threonine protein kinase [Lentisphaeria bacterium]|nr:serine/threonine protein kinase [Lentisphaeria bacterium]